MLLGYFPLVVLLISYQVLTRAANDDFLFEQMVTFYNQNRTTGSLPAQLPKKDFFFIDLGFHKWSGIFGVLD